MLTFLFPPNSCLSHVLPCYLWSGNVVLSLTKIGERPLVTAFMICKLTNHSRAVSGSNLALT